MRKLISEMRAGLQGVTPGPWFQTGAPWFRSGDAVLAGSDDGNVAYIIADCDNFTAPREEYEGPFKLGDPELDAAHIARCSPDNIAALLDSHDELLAALEGVVAVADRKTDEFDRAHAAIARAKGEQP